MRFAARALCAGLLLALSLSTAPVMAQPAAAPPAVEKFFRGSPFGGAILSPSGRYLAVRSGAPGQFDFLAVIDLSTNTAKPVASFNDADVSEFHWVNDERLVFNVGDKRVGQGDALHAPGLFAVNRDGTGLLQLAQRGRSGNGGSKAVRKMLPWHTFMLPQRGAQDSDYIHVVSPVWDTTGKLRHASLLRLNTVTGQSTTVPSPASVQGWMLDHQGEPRLAAGTDKRQTTLYYLDPAANAWRKLASYDPYNMGKSAIVPLGFGPDGTLYVVTRGAGADTSSVHTLDLKTGQVDPQPVISTRGYDFVGSLITDKDKLLGLHFVTDAESEEWIDPGMKAMQAAVDKLLPTTVNLLSVPARAQAPWVLVKAYADAIPPAWWLYNRDSNTISKVGESRPGFDPKRMARQQVIRYTARDGLEIPALLTLPAGKRSDLPLVVLVHGGPWGRGASWGWRPDTQFLASRGYAVLEPEFRGSTGFGAKHFMAGWKQWGMAMQDDVADGTRYLIGKGIADPNRICIAGASYGGYATLMGLVKDPDLYKCGINWIGVTDIHLLFNGSWNYDDDLSDEWKQYAMSDMIGDPVKDSAQFKANSPIAQAARITQPVLMAYGGSDRRVPMSHGVQFRDAVTRHNKNVEWIEYPEEGHGWALARNRIDFWSRVEKFLEKHIGSGAAARP